MSFSDNTALTTPGESSFNDLPVSKAAQVRVHQGLLILRERFAKKVTEQRAAQAKK